jgi:hypothetical protein
MAVALPLKLHGASVDGEIGDQSLEAGGSNKGVAADGPRKRSAHMQSAGLSMSPSRAKSFRVRSPIPNDGSVCAGGRERAKGLFPTAMMSLPALLVR